MIGNNPYRAAPSSPPSKIVFLLTLHTITIHIGAGILCLIHFKLAQDKFCMQYYFTLLQNQEVHDGIFWASEQTIPYILYAVLSKIAV